MEPTKPKRKKTVLRYGMRVRVTDKDSFYYGLTGTLSSLDPEEPYVYLDLDLEVDEEGTDSHAVHMDTVTPMRKSDPDYNGIFTDEDEEEEEDEDEIVEVPMLVHMVGEKING